MEELPRGGPYGEYVSVTPEQVACWKTLREIIHDFLEESVKYDPPFQVSSLSVPSSTDRFTLHSTILSSLQIVKYTIQEMMSQRRHCQERLVRLFSSSSLVFSSSDSSKKFLRQCGLSFGRMNNIYQAISASKTLSEMCEVFELPDLAERARHLPSLTKKRSRAESQREALGQAVEQEQEQESVPLRPDHRFSPYSLLSFSSLTLSSSSVPHFIEHSLSSVASSLHILMRQMSLSKILQLPL
jgi:hypothetical protein